MSTDFNLQREVQLKQNIYEKKHVDNEDLKNFKFKPELKNNKKIQQTKQKIESQKKKTENNNQNISEKFLATNNVGAKIIQKSQLISKELSPNMQRSLNTRQFSSSVVSSSQNTNNTNEFNFQKKSEFICA